MHIQVTAVIMVRIVNHLTLYRLAGKETFNLPLLLGVKIMSLNFSLQGCRAVSRAWVGWLKCCLELSVV